jgi:hypothetical protein
METKQTAVEWLQERYNKNINLMPYDFEQAKEMEKTQIIDAFFGGYNYEGGQLEEKSEDYYSKTYGK